MQMTETRQWTEEELDLLKEGCKTWPGDWEAISTFVGRSVQEIMERANPENAHKKKWTKQEEAMFEEAVEKFGKDFMPLYF